MIAIIISGSNHKLALNFGRQLAKDIFSLNIKNIEIYGPADAKISKIRNKYRIRILLKVEKKNCYSIINQSNNRAKKMSLFYKCKN